MREDPEYRHLARRYLDKAKSGVVDTDEWLGNEKAQGSRFDTEQATGSVLDIGDNFGNVTVDNDYTTTGRRIFEIGKEDAGIINNKQTITTTHAQTQSKCTHSTYQA